jgi:hypothetical protein
MKRDLVGIYEKLKRANESIRNLNGEIELFLDNGLYPILPDQHDEMFNIAVEHHRNRGVPIRFSVLVGEIVHHLRSCFDHMMWQLSSGDKRQRDPNGIEFPVFWQEPLSKDEIARYERKVEGLSGEAKAFVKGLQPHMGNDPLNDPLFIIHDLDRFDKHRELVIIFPGFKRELGAMASSALMQHWKTKSEISLTELERAVKVDSKLAPQIAFAKLGNRESQAVIPSLAELVGYTRIILGDAERLFN